MTDKRAEEKKTTQESELLVGGQFSDESKERAWRSAMEVIRDLGEDPDALVREATTTVIEQDNKIRKLLGRLYDEGPRPTAEEPAVYIPDDAAKERIQQLIRANNEELERRRVAERMVADKRVVNNALVSQLRKFEKRDDRKYVIGFMAGFFVAYLAVEGLRWALS